MGITGREKKTSIDERRNLHFLELDAHNNDVYVTALIGKDRDPTAWAGLEAS